ncbi:histone-lysine N-methyltransferase ATXR2-like protein, partial [Trifolium pratense]
MIYSLYENDKMYVWYHDGYARITVIYGDFPKATEHNFCKITMGHRDSDTSTVIPNIGFIFCLYAATDFKEDELVLKDQMLVGAQHSFNKIDCFVCSFCFRFIGSIETQIGRRLYLTQLRANESHDCDEGSSSKSSKNYHQMDSSDEEESTWQCSSGSSKTKVPLPEGVVESLMNGQL